MEKRSALLFTILLLMSLLIDLQHSNYQGVFAVVSQELQDVPQIESLEYTSISEDEIESNAIVSNITNTTSTSEQEQQIGVPEESETSSSEKAMNSIQTDKTPEKESNLNSSPQISALAPKSCSATSNPCYGTDEDDRMTGDSGPNLMYAKNGNDELNGGEGDDEMYGEDGNDKLWGLGGDDTLIGGEGKDLLYGSYGNDVLNGGPGYGSLYGGYGNDNLYGGSSADFLDGGPGADQIIGGWGNDFISAGNVNSGITGEPDNSKDIIDCGPGIDWVWLNEKDDHDEKYDCEHVNENYGGVFGDSDQDSVPDLKDNCPDVSNNNQIDTDNDDLGDVCDPDHIDADQDFVPDKIDNCLGVSNNSQMDRDGDGKGDACDPFPFNAKTSKVTVRFDSITIHSKHDRIGAGDGEWDLVAYVQGKRVKLTDATTNIVCGGNPPTANCFELWFASNGDTIHFKQGTEVTQEIPDTFPLSIFTVGSEVDDCGRGVFPEVINNLVTSDRPFDFARVTQIQKNYNSYAHCGAIFPKTDNDVLGNLNKAYDISPGQSSYQVKSNNGDFTLKFTVIS